MGRVALACLGITAVLGIAASRPAGAATPPPSRSALQAFACDRSSDSLKRMISVTAVMRPVSGTKRMAIRFELQRRRPDDRTFTDVIGKDLGNWIKPPKRTPPLGQRPGDVWHEIKPVANLSAPAVWRFRVSFRWFGSDQRVLQTVVRLGRRCNQY